MLKILITLAVAAFGGLIFRKLKVPSGAMLGAMFTVIIFNLITGHAYIPRELRVAIQILTGTMIGSKITKKDVFDLRKLLIPCVILVISMVLLNLTFASLMYTAGKLDLKTALFACSPGGMADMAIIADDMGANAVYVVALATSRLLFIYLIVTPLFRLRLNRMSKKLKNDQNFGKEKNSSPPAEYTSKKEPGDVTNNRTRPGKFPRFFLTLATGAVMGLLFWRLGIKAGALFGAMMGVAVLNIATGITFFPPPLSVPLRFVSGAYISQQVTLAGVLMMKTLLIPMLIMGAGVITFTTVIPGLMHYFSGLDMATCMFSSTPGGLQEMSLLAEDFSADVPKVSLLQTVRQITVILIFPNMIAVLNQLFV
jgi:membrane AbrB-like protein